MTGGPEVLLTMPARPEGVGVVRQALAGMADALDFEASVLADMKMAVTEACTNVVVHAYEADTGMLEVEMRATDEGLTIVVRDHGSGIQPRPARSEPPALGLGLPLIAALSDAFELRGSAGTGTEVRMTFAYSARQRPSRVEPGHRDRRHRRPLGSRRAVAGRPGRRLSLSARARCWSRRRPSGSARHAGSRAAAWPRRGSRPAASR